VVLVAVIVVLVALMWFQEQPAPAGMVRIPGGTFWMGRDDGPPDERPAHEVTVKPFFMDTTEVTNAQFAEFVKATGYKTIAERHPDPRNYPGVPLEKLVPGSAVFVPVDAPLYGPWETPVPPWWKYEADACWRSPEGKGSSIEGRDNYPVVQVAWEDAQAFAKWAGKRLPTEAEWEFAARGGLDRKPYTWGDVRQGEGGKWHANTFQGRFPAHDEGLDGFVGLAPVKSFPANGYGLYDMSGNAWEWCADYYDSKYYRRSPAFDPHGPDTGEFEGTQPLRVRRGGSFLCDDNYCRRYLPSARDSNPADSAANHTGFRCVRDVK
jgi:formylglycine-generating enzyme required for sulfatase activity